MNIHIPGRKAGAMTSSTGAAEPGSDIDWRNNLPVLQGERVTLRELTSTDAATLYAAVTTPEAKRFMWAPPPNVVALERFIEWTHAERKAGKYVCYGIVPEGKADAWGIFELRSLQPGFVRGELGFVIAQSLWGTGLFNEAAQLLLGFAFEVAKAHRIEARVAVDNDRSNAALKKLGANQEGTLKHAFWREDHFVDQYLWALLDSEWRDSH
jgi:ribosomal-protein-alanine N-acetyltransferase